MSYWSSNSVSIKTVGNMPTIHLASIELLNTKAD